MLSNVQENDATPVKMSSIDLDGSSEQESSSFDVEDPAANHDKNIVKRKLKPFILLTAFCAALGKPFLICSNHYF